MSDLILWDKLIRGDHDAFEEVYASNFDFLYNYAYRFTGNSELVKEMIQDLFVKILINREHLGDCVNIRAYLTRSLRNKIADHIKLKKETVDINELPAEFLSDDLVLTQMDEVDDETMRIRIRLKNVLKKLPARQKEMIYLRYIRGLSNKEIADIMKMESQSVKNLLLRAKEKIKELLLS